MKKYLFLAIAAIAAFGCQEKPEETLEPSASYRILGRMAGDESKVYIEDTGNGIFKHIFSDGDAISVFVSDETPAAEFSVPTGGGGKSVAYFEGSTQITGNTVYAVYPSNSANRMTTPGTFTVTYPAAQTYTAGSYDPAANVYVAQGGALDGAGSLEEHYLNFVNTTSYLRVSLYGLDSDGQPATVSKIELSTIGGEAIAGTGTVTIQDGSITAPVTISDQDASSVITLNCGDVTIGSTAGEATDFYFAVPSVTFDENFKGYQIAIYSGSGESETHQWRTFSKVMQPNMVRTLSALEYNPFTSKSGATLAAGYIFANYIKGIANPGTTISYVNDDSSNPTRLVSIPDDKITKIVFAVRKNMTGVSGTEIQKGGTTPKIIASYKNGVMTIQTAADTINISDGGYLFNNLTALQEIEGLEGLNANTSGYYNCAFYGCSSLTDLDISSFYVRNITNIKFDHMFYGCTSLKTLSLPLNALNGNNYVRRAASIDSMFYNCSSLTAINNLNLIGSRGTSQSTYLLTSTSGMFSGCSSLKSITLGEYFTCDEVTDMSGMFEGCSGFTSANFRLTYLNTKKVKNASRMFKGVYSNSTGYVNHIRFNANMTFAACTDFSEMFSGCTYLYNIENSNLIAPAGGDNTTISCDSMFSGCPNLGYNTNYPQLDLSGFAPAGKVNARNMFSGTSSGNTYTANKMKKIIFSADGFSLSSGYCMFRYNSGLTNMASLQNFDKLKTSEATSLYMMFAYCTNLTGLNLSNFNTAKVTTMYGMFYGSSKLVQLDLSTFSSAALTSVQYMFANCSTLTSVTFGSNFTGDALTNASNFINKNPSATLTITCPAALETKLKSLVPALSGYTNLAWVNN